MADASEGANNVWSMIGAAASNVANIYRDVTIAKVNAQTRAAPSGNVAQQIANPPPGMFGAFPQAQTKPSYDGAMGGMSPLLWLALALVGAFILIRMR